MSGFTDKFPDICRKELSYQGKRVGIRYEVWKNESFLFCSCDVSLDRSDVIKQIDSKYGERISLDVDKVQVKSDSVVIELVLSEDSSMLVPAGDNEKIGTELIFSAEFDSIFNNAENN